jgi:hypothetical protein
MVTLGRRHGVATVGAMRPREIAGWTVAGCFRRDVVELTR